MRYQEILDVIEQLEAITDPDEWWRQFIQSRKSMTESERNQMSLALPADKFDLLLRIAWGQGSQS